MDFRSDFTIRTKEDLKNAVEEFGFLPYFANGIPGFSIEEHITPEAWFSSEEGAWEWKGPVIRELGCAYGKFFEKKAVYVSREWFPDLANYRRDGYDFDARFDDGLASWKDKELFDLLELHAPVLSRILKEQGNYRKGGKKGFDTIITRLQEQCYVLISDFVYEKDRHGREYGWGIAEYSTPERTMGDAFRKKVYEREAAESFERVLRQLKKINPGAAEADLCRLLK